MCKTVSRRVFLLSKLRYIVDIDTRKLFFNAHIKPHIDYASVVWDGCSDVLKKRLNSLHRRTVKLILPDTTLTTDQKLKEIIIIIIIIIIIDNFCIALFSGVPKLTALYNILQHFLSFTDEPTKTA